jgi:molybdopterin-guanine dinucleotide biosynthesis protein A
MAKQRAIVAVLAGGRGERMGGEKALTPLAGRPLICHPLATAREAGLETVVVAKAATVLPPLAERVLCEPESPRHPLRGVLTALDFAAKRSPAPAVLLLGCDMPFLSGELLAWLAGLQGPAMARVDGRAQPLLSRCLPAQRDALKEALAARRSLRAAIGGLSPRIVDECDLRRFGDPQRMCFNVNDPEDLLLAEHWLSQEGLGGVDGTS